ncbi:FkbM family methyltransferase [Parasedimentitalea huanghaiensis]|uniref:FkbM family methyltransferase n=1 Tax=Parasedimentitalea huanghaiensis TaxID=2682100 RepID=A0A6L6WHK4_9RHOB|nr:FkbM family methyltransferase [Zongyanglinia huanghaiensis]MVO17333.1 FkbM family methyltransferase [Zongyanglinia huanghaiensis]
MKLNKMTSKYFRRYGFQPNCIIDVGVLDGTPFLYKSFPDTKFILVDPLVESQKAVEKRWGDRLNFDFHLCGASDKAGSVNLTITTDGPARSSMTRRLNFDSGATEIREIETRKLDDILEGYEGPFGLKIDTEGNEMSVLRGALKTLANCEFVILETSIKRRFEDGYKFSDVIGFMASQGFEVHSFLSGLTRSPRMADVLFVKWSSSRTEL